MAKRNTDDLDQVMAVTADERTRFNKAIRDGAVVTLPTFNGRYTVKYVDTNWWYHTDGNGGFGQSWAGCNDGAWADLLVQAGVARNPFWERRDAAYRASQRAKGIYA